MRNFVIATAAGAIVGATVSMALPCNKSKFKNRILKRGKKAKSKIVKQIAGFMYSIM